VPVGRVPERLVCTNCHLKLQKDAKDDANKIVGVQHSWVLERLSKLLIRGAVQI